MFCRKAFPWLKLGGVLALIVPHYVLDAEFAELIARGFGRVQVFMAPEQRFRQCVILGVKRRSDRPDPQVAALLEAVGKGELPETMPDAWTEEPYLVPGITEGAEFALRPGFAAFAGYTQTELNKKHNPGWFSLGVTYRLLQR